MKRLALFAIPLAAVILSGCGEDKPPVCKAVDENRAAYQAAEKQENGIARDGALQKAVAEGQARLVAATKDGAFTKLEAKVLKTGLDLRDFETVKLTLPCGATLIAPQLQPSPGLLTALTLVKPGDKVFVDGSFVPAVDGSAPYMEISITDRGKMTDPEFIIRLTSMKSK